MKRALIYKIITFLLLFLIVAVLVLMGLSVNTFSPIRIVLSTDSNYVVPARALINSITANKKPLTKVEINVLCMDLSPTDIINISSKAKFNVKINTILKHRNDLSGLDGYKVTDNLKFYTAELFPNYNKILYLDADIIVLKDLSKLYRTPLRDNYAGVVTDWYIPAISKDLYFNNGVLLLNLKQIRKDNIGPKLINAKINDKQKRFVSQDVFNQVMQGKVKYLPIIYNTSAHAYEQKFIALWANKLMSLGQPEKGIDVYKTPEQYRNDAVILHYCGWYIPKPWIVYDAKSLSNQIWYKYAPPLVKEYNIYIANKELTVDK